MSTFKIHLFGANFDSPDEALAFFECDWGDAPDEETVSAEEFDAWESEFPKWALKDELGQIYLDEDYIETHFGAEVRIRLESIEELDTETALMLAQNYNAVIVIGEEALGGFEVEIKSTPRLKYLGVFTETL